MSSGSGGGTGEMPTALPPGIPKYLHLAQILRSAIHSGDVGKKGLRIADNRLMERFGVSRSTVRQAVEVLVREGLVYREPGRGTFIREIPPGGAETFIEVVGWSFEAIVENHYVRDIVMGIERTCEEQETAFRFYPVREDSLVRGPLGDELRDNTRQVGVTLLWPYPQDEVAQLIRWGVPVVATNMDFTAVGAGSVVTNAESQKTMGLLLEPLERMGHRRIAFLLSDELSAGKSSSLARGYRLASLDLGLGLDEDYFSLISRHPARDGGLLGAVDETPEAVGDALDGLMASEQPPTAVLVGNEPLLECLVEAAERRGLEIPEDLSVGGITTVDFDEFYSSVRLDQRAIGETAARMLLEMLEEETPARKEVVEVEYHEGGSFGPPSARN